MLRSKKGVGSVSRSDPSSSFDVRSFDRGDLPIASTGQRLPDMAGISCKRTNASTLGLSS